MTTETPKQYLITYTMTETQWFGSEDQARQYARDFAPSGSYDTLDIDVEEMN